MNFAPIVLFVYNRPWHTRQTLNALMQNELANQSVIFIYSDGPKENATGERIEKIEEVRKVITEQQWCKEVHIVEAKKNKGLADSIVEGVTEIVNKYGKIIVLEDDIVTSPGFLKYMNDALSLYENEEKVYHVSGFMFPVKEKLPETFFYNATSCWGWATWARSWKYLNLNPENLYEQLKRGKLFKKYDYKGLFGFTRQLQDNIHGRLYTWAIKWHTSVFLKKGLCLHPGRSLVNNIGNDSSGENCNTTEKYLWPHLAEKVDVKPIQLKELRKARWAMIKFSLPENVSFPKFYYDNLSKKIVPPVKRTLKSILHAK